jgi:hypothetical protein
MFLLVLVLLVAVESGCGFPLLRPTATAVPAPTPDLPPSDGAAFAFLQAWERGDYAAMYSLLSPTAQEQVAEERFTET